MNRREFIGTAAALTATAAHGWAAPLPRRPYKDGTELSIIALGGIVICGLSQGDATRRVAEAYDRGVNYFDCAPSYFDGEAESKLGEALKPYRSKVFLAEKTMSRDAKGAREELERTLERFHTDHVDLYQFHAVSSMDDVEKILAPAGAAETFFAARKEGKVRQHEQQHSHAGHDDGADEEHQGEEQQSPPLPPRGLPGGAEPEPVPAGRGQGHVGVHAGHHEQADGLHYGPNQIFRLRAGDQYTAIHLKPGGHCRGAPW